MKKLFVLDTNVLMHDPTSLFRFEEHDLYLPIGTLEELDANKKGLSDVSRNARQASRFLDEIVSSEKEDIKDGSVSEYFKLLRPWIFSCHINDLYKDSTEAYPYRELFRLMREAGYDRVTLCEVGRALPDAASGEEFLRYYKALWMELTK